MVSLNKNEQDSNALAALVQKAIAGDEIAFGRIYDLYFEKIYRFVFYRCGSKETAEDLVAETFIRVWGKLSEIKETDSFNGWVYQIARNLVIDHYRSRKVTVTLEGMENILEYEENFLERADLGFQQKKFLELVKKLSPDEQTVLKLKFFDDLPNKEIAKILNKSEGAIRVIQHRAISELKNLIDQDEPR